MVRGFRQPAVCCNGNAEGKNDASSTGRKYKQTREMDAIGKMTAIMEMIEDSITETGLTVLKIGKRSDFLTVSMWSL